MNFGAPAQCNATVTAWRYCYYNQYTDDECDDPISFRSVFMAYRRTEKSTYTPVTGSYKEVKLSLRCPRDGGFKCLDVALSLNEQFNIQQNDIVAACMFSTRPIVTVGYDNSGLPGHVYRFNTPGIGQCPFQIVDTQNSGFTLDQGHRFHLNAKTDSKCSYRYFLHYDNIIISQDYARSLKVTL